MSIWKKEAKAFDQSLRKLWAQPASLNPNQGEAQSLWDLGNLAQTMIPDVHQFDEVMMATITVAHIQLDCFPKNIFWDLDGFVKVFWSLKSTSEIKGCIEQLERLYRAFSEGQTRFQYAHDLIFGFDWARWVQKDPVTRASIGPFEATFLDRMEHRHQQLVEEVKGRDSEKYPYMKELETNEGFRNPFGFSREYEDEIAVMTELAAQNFIPVPFWNIDFQAEWDKPYERVRKQIAG